MAMGLLLRIHHECSSSQIQAVARGTRITAHHAANAADYKQRALQRRSS
jgi:hypothetical protein